VASLGYLPSFCTACYRLNRTGEDFMKLAKKCKIKTMCAPNALVTFAEYLNDYASPETKAVGEKLIQSEVLSMISEERKLTEALLAKIGGGQRDVFI
jgi:2-iminoacetate synthase